MPLLEYFTTLGIFSDWFCATSVTVLHIFGGIAVKEQQLGAETYVWQGRKTRCDCVFLICDLSFYTAGLTISFFSPKFIMIRENEDSLPAET